MIKEIKIENFKSIQSLNLELGRLNVFIGANGSGKSNILEGIAFGAVAAKGVLSREFLGTRGVRITDNQYFPSGFTKISTNTFSVSFSNQAKEDIKYIFDTTHDVWTVIADDALQTEFVSENKEDFEKQFLTLYKSLRNKLSEAEFENASQRFIADLKIANFTDRLRLQDFMIFAPENYFLRRFEEETQIKPLGIRGEGLFSHLVKIFTEKPNRFKTIQNHLTLIDWFESLDISSDLTFAETRLDFKDQFLSDGLKNIDQRSVNEGILYLLFYLTLFISDDTPKFFAIDNIDNAMNPKLGRELIKTLAKLSKKEEHDKQVILTTHNPAILDGLNLNDDEQRLFVIYRNAYGHTKATRIFKTETPEGQRPLPLSEQFLRGYLGGLPDNF
jgi:predicted ATPase